MAFLDGQELQPGHLELPGVCSCPHQGAIGSQNGPGLPDLVFLSTAPWGWC